MNRARIPATLKQDIEDYYSDPMVPTLQRAQAHWAQITAAIDDSSVHAGRSRSERASIADPQ
jgi:hypothetical protein